MAPEREIYNEKDLKMGDRLHSRSLRNMAGIIIKIDADAKGKKYITIQLDGGGTYSANEKSFVPET